MFERASLKSSNVTTISVTKDIKAEFDKRRGSQPAVDYLIHLMELEDKTGGQTVLPGTPRQTGTNLTDAVGELTAPSIMVMELFIRMATGQQIVGLKYADLIPSFKARFTGPAKSAISAISKAQSEMSTDEQGKLIES